MFLSILAALFVFFFVLPIALALLWIVCIALFGDGRWAVTLGVIAALFVGGIAINLLRPYWDIVGEWLAIAVISVVGVMMAAGAIAALIENWKIVAFRAVSFPLTFVTISAPAIAVFVMFPDNEAATWGGLIGALILGLGAAFALSRLEDRVLRDFDPEANRYREQIRSLIKDSKRREANDVAAFDLMRRFMLTNTGRNEKRDKIWREEMRDHFPGWYKG